MSGLNIEIDVNGFDVSATVEYTIFGKFLPETLYEPAEYPEIETVKLFLGDGTDATVLLNNNGINDSIIDLIITELEE